MIYLLGFLAFMGVIMMLVGYALKVEGDKENGLFIAGMTLALVSMFILGGYWFYRQEHKVKYQIKPSVEIVIKDGKADTTYIYKFEEKE